VPILDRDEDWIHLLKPPGVFVFPPHDDPDGDCVLRRLLAVAPEQADALPEDVDSRAWAGGILHRLDRWTSGLLVAARHPDAFVRGRAAFASHRLSKVYRFLSGASPAWTENRIDAPLAHDPRRRTKMVWKRGKDTPHRGRWYPAATAFRIVQTVARGTIWEARMSTGVMHQIRVHAAAVGIPLLGDRLYGGAPGERYHLHHCTIEGWPGGAPVAPAPEWR
jgi:23S rRNA pseudouridine1911/1915/1917 synthase